MARRMGLTDIKVTGLSCLCGPACDALSPETGLSTFSFHATRRRGVDATSTGPDTRRRLSRGRAGFDGLAELPSGSQPPTGRASRHLLEPSSALASGPRSAT